MRLKIDLNGIILQLKIKCYTSSTCNNWDSQWCNVDFSFSSGNWLNYHRENYEILLCCEVEALADSIENLLNNQIKEVTKISCIEPDFNFTLYPKRNLVEDQEYSCTREGFEIADIYMEWTVALWNGGMTDNYLSVTLDRENINILLVYLKYVIGKLKKTDHGITELVKRDFLTD